MKNIAVLASGNGSNFEAIVRAVQRGRIKARVGLLVVDKNECYALTRAKRLKIKSVFIDPGVFKTRLEFDKKLLSVLKREKIDLIALAGFMRLLSPFFVQRYRKKILNIHPSLLPAFRGVRAIKRAYDYGVKVTGVTVHFVDEGLDSGPIIIQRPLFVREEDSLSLLESRIHRLEHRLYPLAIRQVLDSR